MFGIKTLTDSCLMKQKHKTKSNFYINCFQGFISEKLLTNLHEVCLDLN